MFEFIFGRSNPTRNWTACDNRSFRFQVDDASLNGVRIGEPLGHIAILGPLQGRADYSDRELRYYSLGLCVDYDEADQRIAGFHVVYRDECELKYSPFGGEVVYQNEVVDAAHMKLADCDALFGENYYLDVDEDETIAYYNFASLKWQVEFGNDGQLNRLIALRINEH
jgi:hypothetical protein